MCPMGSLCYSCAKKKVARGKKIPERRERGTKARGLLRRRRRFQLQCARVAKTLRRETSEPTCRGRRPPPPVCTHVKTQLASRTSVPYPSATFPHLQFSDRGGSVGITVMPIPSRKENVHVSFAAILSFHIYGFKNPFSHGGTLTT